MGIGFFDHWFEDERKTRFVPMESGWNTTELLACKLVSLDVEKVG